MEKIINDQINEFLELVTVYKWSIKDAKKAMLLKAFLKPVINFVNNYE